MTLADDLRTWTFAPRLGGHPVDPGGLARRLRDHPGYDGDPALLPRYGADLRRDLCVAERLVLEDDFVRDVVRLAAPGGRVNRPLVERALLLARAPFPVTWIEWSADAMAAEQAAQGTLPEIPPDRPPRLGYLLRASDDGARWRFQEFSAPPPDRSWADAPGPALVRGGLSTVPLAGSHPHPRRTPGGTAVNVNSVLNRAALLVGSTAAVTARSLPGENGGEVAAWPPLNQIALDLDELTYAALFDLVARRGDRDADMVAGIENDVRELAGSLRFLVFALALINCAAIDYRTEERAPARVLRAGRSVPYLTHRTVRIVVPPGIRSVTRYLTTTIAAAHRRAHAVRGHWRAAHFRRARLIERQWVRPHTRGDASLGFINQDHTVATR